MHAGARARWHTAGVVVAVLAALAAALWTAPEPLAMALAPVVSVLRQYVPAWLPAAKASAATVKAPASAAPVGGPRVVTAEELLQHDGRDPTKPVRRILVGSSSSASD